MSTPRFKAWDIRNNKMVDDALSLSETNQLVTVNADYFNSPFSFFDGCKWLMYSGMMSLKNGKEVCEGDVVRFINAWASEEEKNQGINDEILTLPVFYEHGCFKVGSSEKWGYLHHYVTNKKCNLEILGNIYENPDLKLSH